MIVRYLLNRWGYKLGTGFSQKDSSKWHDGKSHIRRFNSGLMVVGAMTASMIDLTIPITISGSGKKMQSQFKVSLTISCLNYYRLHLFGFVFIY